jgi:chromosome segregation ATPase
MKTPRRTAAPIALALCLAWPLVQAQTTTPAKPAKPGATKSFGGSKPGGKLLTRDELRACMKMQADMKSGGATLERDKAELQREKAELQQAGEALKADKDTLERTRTEATAAFKAKADAHAQRISDFNAKNAELTEMEKKESRGNRADRMRRDMEKEHADLKKADEVLRTEMDALNRSNADGANALNARVAAHEQKVREWNERNDAFTTRVNSRQSVDDRWMANCADRRYDELDEIAIEQGR